MSNCNIQSLTLPGFLKGLERVTQAPVAVPSCAIPIDEFVEPGSKFIEAVRE